MSAVNGLPLFFRNRSSMIASNSFLLKWSILVDQFWKSSRSYISSKISFFATKPFLIGITDYWFWNIFLSLRTFEVTLPLLLWNFYTFHPHLTHEVFCLPSPDQLNSGGADWKYFIGPLKVKSVFFWVKKHFLR